MTRRRAVLVGVTGLVAVALVAILTAWPGDQRVETAMSTTTTSSTTTAPTTRSTTSTSSTTTTTTTTTTTATTIITSTTRSTTAATTSSPRTSTTAPPTIGPAIAVRRGDPSRPVVALTFDAGSDVGNASSILDTLESNGIRAAFGVTGRWAEDHPDLVARMASDGHQLLNHSYDHPSFTGVSTDRPALSRAERLDQLSRADTAIQAATGQTSAPWFRPPYGDEDASVRADVASAGYRYEVMWTVDSLGWRGAGVAEIVDRCLAGAQNGAIFLFHVGAASADAAALQRVIDGLRDAGYGFGTVAEIL